MAYQNAKDFSDPYILLYGHHMENGSMFGDVFAKTPEVPQAENKKTGGALFRFILDTEEINNDTE